MILKGFGVIMSVPLTSLAVGGLESPGVGTIVGQLLKNQLLEIGRVRLGGVLGSIGGMKLVFRKLEEHGNGLRRPNALQGCF